MATYEVDLCDRNLAKIPEEVLLNCANTALLDLSHNPGLQLNNELRRFIHLRTLVLSDCGLIRIPEEICALTELQELHLSDNICSDGLTSVIERLRRLKVLDLRNCKIESLPDNISNLQQLEELLLGNDFAEKRWNLNSFMNGISTKIGQLILLTKLNLRNCAITALPDGIGNLENLKELLLGRNNFAGGVNQELSRLRHLQVLDLTYCELKKFPNCIEHLEQLLELHLCHNPFDGGVPEAIGRLVRLKKLDLRNCYLESLPGSIFDLQQLEEILVGNDCCEKPNYWNFFKDFSPAKGQLIRLKKLNLTVRSTLNLPGSIVHLEQLADLQLRSTILSASPTFAKRLTRLQKLDLTNCDLTDVPDSVRYLENLEELHLGWNRLTHLDTQALRPLFRLKVLDLAVCGFETFPDSVGDLVQLQELHLSGNYFVDGKIHSAIGRLVQLKKLALQNCGITNLHCLQEDSIFNLKQLEELNLGNDHPLHNIGSNCFSRRGIPSAIGQLISLKKLNLWGCAITYLPDSIGNLVQLLELNLVGNNFGDGITDAIGKLSRLRKLNLDDCNIENIPDSIYNLEQLQELIFWDCISAYPRNSNRLSSGVSSEIGRLVRLKKLNLRCCNISMIPESITDLQQLTELHLPDHSLTEYPLCTLRLKNLRVLDLSTATGGNCIKQLPVELAYTSLEILHLKGNPITEPPEAIWTQGLKAIKSFMRALIPGGSLLYSDTLNLIGDTGAGKTSLAQSLVVRSPHTTKEADRTHVLQQLSMKIDEKAGLSVNINDFGGHDIYHSVIPIFLPVNGLAILVFNLNDEKRKDHVKKWLLTAVAKSSEIRVIIVGAHADEVGERRSDLEIQLLEFVLECLENACFEVSAHINHLSHRSDGAHTNKFEKLHLVHKNLKQALADFSQSVIDEVKKRISRRQTSRTDDEHCNLENLKQLLARLKNNVEKSTLQTNKQRNVVRLLTLSCLVADDGLDELQKLVVTLLHPPETLPIRWCRVIIDMLKQSADYLYLTMAQVEKICRVYFTASDDSAAVKTILRYLAKTSQIIWLEDHVLLCDYIFHSPRRIIKMCKKLLYHKIQSLSKYKECYKPELEAYDKGILLAPLLKELLSRNVERHTPSHEQAPPEPHLSQSDVVLHFMEQFNLMSCVRSESGSQEYIIPCHLSSAAPSDKLRKVEHIGSTCLNRVIVRLSFIGSIIPMSLFETSLSIILSVVGKVSGYRSRPDIWSDGVIIVYDGVYFIAKRHVSVITLVAFSKPHSPSPWTILHPVLKILNDSINASWHGAPPHCAVVCPGCARRIQVDDPLFKMGEIPEDLTRLALTYERGQERPMCQESCCTIIPQSLCYATVAEGSFTNDQSDIEEFFRDIVDRHEQISAKDSSQKRRRFSNSDANEQVDSADESSSKSSKQSDFGTARGTSVLQKTLRRMMPEFHQALRIDHVQNLALYTFSKEKLNDSEWETISNETNPLRAKNSLLSCMLSGGDSAIQCFAEALRYIEKHDLANKLCPLGQTDQRDAAAHH